MRLLREAEITRTELTYATATQRLHLRSIYGREEDLLSGNEALKHLGGILKKQSRKPLSERSNLFVPQPRALDDQTEKALLEAFLACDLIPTRTPRCREGFYLMVTPPADSTGLSSLSLHTRFGSAGVSTPQPEHDIHIPLALLDRAVHPRH